MPTFCRHNRLIQNCPICSREQAIEMRPVVSPGRGTSSPAHAGGSGESRPKAPSRTGSGGTRTAAGLRVRRLARGAEDGYSSGLVPGLKSSQEAARLADELAHSAARLQRLRDSPWGIYAEVADPSADLEERTWLAFQLAALGVADEGEDDVPPLLASKRTSWASGADPDVADGDVGARGVTRPDRVFAAYRMWVSRAGSQARAFSGDPGWSAERRFARVYERLALPGLERDPRFEFLVLLGSLGLYELSAASLQLGGTGEVTVAAKRVFGIGDVLLLERRAADLASAAQIPLAALDLALYNWGRGSRVGSTSGDLEAEGAFREGILAALGL